MPAAAASIVRTDDMPAVLRLGDHRALDFLNSVYTPQHDAIDLLQDGRSLLYWLGESAVVSAPVAEVTRTFTPAQLHALAGEARGLREWFRSLLMRWCAQGARAVGQADLARLNALLADSRLTQAIVAVPDGLALQTLRAIDGPAAVLAELAAGCAELLATHRADQVRRCENPACTLWFADTKRGPRRRWCAMALCGNRMKVAAHRARTRGASAV